MKRKLSRAPVCRRAEASAPRNSRCTHSRPRSRASSPTPSLRRGSTDTALAIALLPKLRVPEVPLSEHGCYQSRMHESIKGSRRILMKGQRSSRRRLTWPKVAGSKSSMTRTSITNRYTFTVPPSSATFVISPAAVAKTGETRLTAWSRGPGAGWSAQRQLHLPIDDNYTSPSQAPPERTG
jgi:hypothetical protein